MSGFGSRPTAAPIPVDANRQALAQALLGLPARVGQAFTGMAQSGLAANEAFMQGRGQDGEDLYARPFLPNAETGGRIGALSGFLMDNMAMGGPAGSLGAGPTMRRTVNPIDYGVAPEFAARVASEYRARNANPQKLARALLGADAPAETVSNSAKFAADVRTLKADRLANRPGMDPLEFQAQYGRPRALENIAAEKPLRELPWFSEIPTAQKNAALLRARAGGDPDLYLRTGYLDALQAQFEQAGWKARHVSTDKSGRATSRYMVSPDGQQQIRLSDHDLPIRSVEGWDGYSTSRYRGAEYVAPSDLYGADAPASVARGLLDTFKK